MFVCGWRWSADTLPARLEPRGKGLPFWAWLVAGSVQAWFVRGCLCAQVAEAGRGSRHCESGLARKPHCACVLSPAHACMYDHVTTVLNTGR